MRVFVTGGSGTLGRELLRAFDGHDVIAPSHGSLDVTNRDAVHDAVASSAPDAIVHAAAFTNVDGCEDDADRAFAGNAPSTRRSRRPSRGTATTAGGGNR